jgi:hypothetical protein
MEDARENSVVVVTLSVLCTVVALACALAIGAVAVLVVLAASRPTSTAALAKDAAAASNAAFREPVFRGLPAPQEGECAVVLWNAGMIYCVHEGAPLASKKRRSRPGVVVEAKADQ